MAVRLNHTIVAARDKAIAAKFLTEILGLPAPSLLGPFAVLPVSDDTNRARISVTLVDNLADLISPKVRQHLLAMCVVTTV